MIRALLLVAVLGGTAAAETKHAKLPEGMALDVVDGSLLLREGAGSYRIDMGILSITSVTVAARAVDLVLSTNRCEEVQRYHFTLDELHARGANAVAYQQHVKHAYAAARPGFTHAVALDPAWPIAAYNLASADVALHDDAGALAALAPHLAKDPLATYAQIVMDPELRPLRGKPELAAIVAPGTHARIAVPVAARVLGYSAAKDLLAVTRVEAGWGACVFVMDVELWNASARTLAATARVIEADDTDPMTCGALPKRSRARVAERAARAADLLEDLGVDAVPIEAGALTAEDDKTRVVFGGAKLGLVAKDELAHVFRGNTELASGPVLHRLEWGQYVAAAHAIVTGSIRPGREGCEGTDPTQTTIFALPR
ncbi:MAG TPA: hypothetical protein VGM88_27790 [Kofleriaceae bacterium]